MKIKLLLLMLFLLLFYANFVIYCNISRLAQKLKSLVEQYEVREEVIVVI